MALRSFRPVCIKRLTSRSDLRFGTSRGLSRRYEKRAERLTPNDPGLRAAQALIAFNRKQHRYACVTAQSTLETGAATEMRPTLQRVLALSAVRSGPRAEALIQLDVAIALMPEDDRLRFERGELKRALGHREEAWQDFALALRFAEDEEERSQAQYELDHTR